MPVVFAAAMSHAPGITAWAEAAPAEQKERLYAGFARLGVGLAQARPEALVVYTAEHWANFFLNHMPAFCIGRAEDYAGPVEPWLRVPKARVAGAPALANALLEACYDAGFEASFSEELELDHGTMVPLHFLTPRMDVPVVPIFINTLAKPMPRPERCYRFGETIGKVLRASAARIAVIATGGMSHWPGDREHGTIDSDFDREFLRQIAAGETERLRRLNLDEIGRAGTGAMELLNWIALAGTLNGPKGEIVAYEAVKPWATGCGLVGFDAQAIAACA